MYLHKPRLYSLGHTLAIRYGQLLLGYKHLQHVVGNCNTMVNIIKLYYKVIILWDQRNICGLLLTVMSLCGAWLHVTSWTEVDIQFAVFYRPNSTQLFNTALYICSSHLCFVCIKPQSQYKRSFHVSFSSSFSMCTFQSTTAFSPL